MAPGHCPTLTTHTPVIALPLDILARVVLRCGVKETSCLISAHPLFVLVYQGVKYQWMSMHNPERCLHKLCTFGDPSGVQQVLSNAIIEHEALNTALLIASSHGHSQIATLLISKGADVRASNDEALLVAATLGHADVVRVFLKTGANVHVHQDSAVCSAASHGHTATVKVLLQHGADLHANQERAIRYAAFQGHAETVRLLLEYGADVHVDQDYLLRCARLRGFANVVEALLQYIS